MADDIELAINLVQAVNLSVLNTVYAGNTAYDASAPHAPSLENYLTVLDSANLPYVLTWPGPSRFYSKGGGWIVDMETLMIVCYVQPLGLNDIPSRATEAVRLYQVMRRKYTTVATIPLASPATSAGYQITAESGPNSPHSSDGIQSNLNFAGKPYLGFTLHLNVRIQFVPS